MKNPPLYHAVFSSCRRYRYEWHYRWGEGPVCMFIGLNPSTADDFQMDPTVRRCVDYVQRWGFGALCMTNLFAWRDTDPEAMKQQPQPIGPKNDATLKRLAAKADLVIAAWGCHGSHLQRGDAVRQMLPNIHALKVNQDCSPAHPLYLSKKLQPISF
ncbi:MAG TPA: hypothetical protein DIT13_15260 [Verrucomicrobiales bacterium]|nr:hypothetical protein [Verrucomicrobiales bacterium]HRJ08674.1 DUF1643 domain-containing protein [Prosthecobacter sp.]HRK14003.1 DUF1643 domain-containing protein [Prosthecobacter sp.]